MGGSGLNALAFAALWPCSEYEEIYSPSVDEFVYISDNTYTREQVSVRVLAACAPTPCSSSYFPVVCAFGLSLVFLERSDSVLCVWVYV